jgi:hypothetical protein
MKRTNIGVFVLLFALAGAAFAAEPVNEPREAPENAAQEFTWNGKLVDQACKDKSIDRNCPVTPQTERFGLVVDGGTILPFDEASNQAARDALAKGNHKGNVAVSVVGARDQGLFKVESIQVKK